MAEDSSPKSGAADPRPSRADKARPIPSRKEEARETLVVERRSGFFMRWLKRLVGFILLLLLILGLAFVGVTLVLRSSMPRSIAESVATGLLKLDVRLGEVDVGWAGDITIRDLEVRLPADAEETELSLINEPVTVSPPHPPTQSSSTQPVGPAQATRGDDGPLLLQVPLIEVELPMLPLVAFNALIGQDPDVKSITVTDPIIYLTEEADGGWNVLRALALLSTGGSPEDPESPPGPPEIPPLPEVTLTGGTLVVSDIEGNRKEITGIKASAARRGPLIYTFSATMPDRVGVAGRLVPSSGLRQEIALEARNLTDLLSPVLELPDVAARVKWNGRFTNDGGISGLVTIQEGTRFEATTLEGTVHVDQGETGLTLAPKLVAENIPGGVGRAELVSGEISVIDQVATVQDLLLNVYHGRFLVETAAYNLESETGHFETVFTDLQPVPEADIGGSVAGSLGYGTFGQPVATITTDIHGQYQDRRIQHLNTLVEATGVGDRGLMGLLSTDVRLTVQDPPLVLGAAQESIVLPRTTAQVLVRLAEDDVKRIELAELRSLDPEVVALAGAGIYFVEDSGPTTTGPLEGVGPARAGDYWLWLEQKGWPVRLPRMEESLPLELGVELRGRLAGAVLEPVRVVRIYGNLADIQIDGAGWYVPDPESAAREMFDELAEVGTPEWAPARRPLGPTNAPPQNALAGLEDAGQASEDLIERWERIVASRPTQWTGDEAASILPENPPLRLRLTMARTPQTLAPTTPGAAALADASQPLREEAETVPIQGAIQSWLDIGGSFSLGVFEGYGGLVTSDFSIDEYQLGDTNTRIAARLDEDRVLIATPEPTKLLGAEIEFSADIPRDVSEPGIVVLSIAGLELERLSAAVAVPNPLSGQLNGALTAQLRGFSPEDVSARGLFSVTELATPFVYLADELTLTPTFADETLNLAVRLRHEAPIVAGPVNVTESRTIEAELVYSLDMPQRLIVRDVEAVDYPLLLSPQETGINQFAQVLIGLEARELTAMITDQGLRLDGALEASGDVRVGEKQFELTPLVDSRLRISGNGSQIEIEELLADLPGLGRIVGGGRLSLQDLAVESKLWLHGEQLDLPAIARRLNVPEGAAGTLNFSLTSEKITDPRSPGELLLNLSFAGDEARWRAVEIDQGQIIAYLARDPLGDGTAREGAFAFTLLSTERLNLHVGGGRIDGFFKVRYHGDRPDGLIDAVGQLAELDPGERLFVQGNTTIDDLQLGQLTPLAGRSETGLIDARLVAFGDLNEPAGREERRTGEAPRLPINGSGQVHVDEGEFASFNIIRKILQFAQLIPGSREDEADVEFRLEAGNLFITSADIFADGVQIKGNGQITNVLDPEKARIDASVAVFERTLSQIPLPFFEEADDIFSALQSNLTAVSVTGPLDDPVVVQKSLEALGSTLRALLVGSAKNPEP